MKNIIRQLRWWWYDLVNGISHLINWFPIIWRDRDFDNHYIEVILLHKLRNTLYFFESKNSVTDWTVPEQAKALQALRICVTILERKQNDFYVMICDTMCSKEEIENIVKCEERDMKIFGKLFGKYLSYWWD